MDAYGLLVKYATEVNEKCSPDEYNFSSFRGHGKRSRWWVKSENLANLWYDYCEMTKDSQEPLDICIAEKMPKIAPITADFNFTFTGIHDEAYDGEQLLPLLTGCYQHAVKEIFADIDEGSMYCVVLEYHTKGKREDDCESHVRLQFPYCRTDATSQEKVKALAIKQLRLHNATAKMNFQPVGDWSEIICIPKELELYGSSKSPDQPPMQMSKVYLGVNLDDLDEDYEIDFEEYIDSIFSPTNHGACNEGILDAEVLEGEDPLYWLPLFFSPNYWLGSLTLKRDEMVADDESALLQDDDDYSICKKLLPLLAPFRWVENWHDLATAIYNATEGSKLGLDLLEQWSKKYPSDYTEQAEELYTTLNRGKITIRTLAWYANIDSPSAYREWHNDWCVDALDHSLSLLDVDVAKALYRTYWLLYICASVSKTRWYRYANHRWVETDHGVEIRKLISDQFIYKFECIRVEMAARVRDSMD